MKTMQVIAPSIVLSEHQLGRYTIPRWSRVAILACMCSLLIPRGADFQIGTILIDYTRVTLTVLAIMAAEQVLSGKVQLQTTLADWFILGHIAVIALSALWHEGIDEGLEIAVGQVLVDMGLAYFVARVAIRDLQCYRYFIRIVVLIAVISAVIGLSETFTGYNIVRAVYHTIFPRVLYVYLDVKRLGLYRAYALFGTDILFGAYCMVAFALAACMKHRNLGMSQRMYRICLVLCLLGVFSSLSSGPWMGMAFCFFCLTYDWVMRCIRSRWKLFIFCGVAIFLFLRVFSGRGPIKILIDYTLDPQTGYVRLAMWECVWALMPKYWLLGWGWTNDWPRAVEWYFFHSVDSFYAVNLIRSGVFSVLFILGSLFYAWYRLSRVAGQKHLETNEAKGWILGTACLFFTAITVDIFGNMVSATYFLLGAGQTLFTAYEKYEFQSEHSIQTNHPLLSTAFQR